MAATKTKFTISDPIPEAYRGIPGIGDQLQKKIQAGDKIHLCMVNEYKHKNWKPKDICKRKKKQKIFYTETQTYFLTNFNVKIQYNMTVLNNISNNIYVHVHSVNFLYQW